MHSVLEKGLHFGFGSTLGLFAATIFAGPLRLICRLAQLSSPRLRNRPPHRRHPESASNSVPQPSPLFFRPTRRGRSFSHQLRWSRTIRDARRWGYAGLLFTFGLPWALATVLAARGAAWAWILLALTLACRLAVGLGTAVLVLQDRQAIRNIVWMPLRDLLAPFFWAASFMGNRIHWRGDVFSLKNGRLIQVQAVPSAGSRK